METVMSFLGTETRAELIWVLVGLGGQIMFMMRFLIQWIVSEGGIGGRGRACVRGVELGTGGGVV